MHDLKFNCPHCHQRLGAPAASLGRTVACPNCAGHIRLPDKPQAVAPLSRPDPDPAGAPGAGPHVSARRDIKFSCPSCQAHLVIDARGAGKSIPCVHCGALMKVPAVTPEPAPADEPVAQAQAAAPKKPLAPVQQPASAPADEPAPQTLKAAAPKGPPALVPQDSRQVAALIERVRGGDLQAGPALLRLGECVIPALVESFKENSLEEPPENAPAGRVADLLVKCGAVCVPLLAGKLGKCRHAYLTLGRIGSDEAVRALTAELSSVNWRRVEVACQALALVQTPSGLSALDALEKARSSTRSGEVFAAAGAALAALRTRFGKPDTERPKTLQEMVAQSKVTPLKALVTKPTRV